MAATNASSAEHADAAAAPAKRKSASSSKLGPSKGRRKPQAQLSSGLVQAAAAAFAKRQAEAAAKPRAAQRKEARRARGAA